MVVLLRDDFILLSLALKIARQDQNCLWAGAGLLLLKRGPDSAGGTGTVPRPLRKFCAPNPFNCLCPGPACPLKHVPVSALLDAGEDLVGDLSETVSCLVLCSLSSS